MSEDLQGNLCHVSDQEFESLYKHDLGLLLDEFTVVCVGGVVPFLVNNFIFPETEKRIFSLCLLT